MAQKITFDQEKIESSLIAAIAAKPETYWEIIDILPPLEAFTRYKNTYAQIIAAIEKDQPLPTFNGEPAADPVAAARELAERFQRRLLADLARNFLKNIDDRKNTPTALIVRLEEDLIRVQQTVREMRAGQVMSLSDLLPEVVADAKARRQAVKEQGVAAVGLPTGIQKLDKLMGGLQPGLHLLAAEPGMGKTTFALQLAANVSKAGYPALYVSFEETLERLALKTLCAKAGIEAKRFADGYGDPLEIEQAASKFGPELESIYFVEGTMKTTVSQVKAKALQMVAKKKVPKCLILIDYLQRWASTKREFADFRHTVSNLVSELRELALRLNSPVLVISSQNRPGQGSASLVSLKESGDLEYSADTVNFLVTSQKRPAVPPARAVDLVIEKNRYGDKGRVELIFRPDIGSFREVAK